LLQRILKWHGAPRNFDISGRFGRTKAFSLMERAKIVMGDAAMIKLGNLKLQAIESDLIAKGNYDNGEKVTDSGLVVDDYGKVQKYCICKRSQSGNQYEFDHLEPAENVIFAAHWTRFGSQFRGVSPLATALNTVSDLMEATEYNILKAKLAAVFGLAIMREADPSGSMGGAGGATAETAGADTTATGTSQDLNPRAGINILDMLPGEKVEVIESKTPSAEFVDASYLYIQLALLALDIPITAFDSRRSSFSARIADLNEYEVASRGKRRQNGYKRQEYSDWLIREIYNDPRDPWSLQQVARNNGMTLRDVQEAIEWVPAGYPWLDKYKQVQGDQLAIELNLDNPQDAARRRGSDAFKNVDKKLQVEKYEKEQRQKENMPLPDSELSVDAAIRRAVADALAANKEDEEPNE